MRLELKLLKRSEREKINNSNEVGSVRLCVCVDAEKRELVGRIAYTRK
jgi:hypothetical protein